MDPDYQPPSAEILEWVRLHLHERARVTEVARLAGGITADMDRVRVESPAGWRDVVLRRWSSAYDDEDLVAAEAAALEAVRGHDVPAPTLLGADPDGCETGVRCTLTSYLPGQPDLSPANMETWLEQLASTQAAIHAIPQPAGSPDDRYGDGARDRYDVRERPLDWLADTGLREAAREAAQGPLSEETVLVHGDYQHFNVLWQDSRLTGVVDWPSAGVGHRGSDVGHCRLNLAVLFGAGVAHDYLVRYERAAEARVDRRADLRALLCFDLEWQTFIPQQVNGRTLVDVATMPDRVTATVRDALGSLV